MSTAYVIETERHAAGIAVAEGRGFRFYSSHGLYAPLDGRLFASVAEARRAVMGRLRAGGDPCRSRRRDSRGEIYRGWGGCADQDAA